MKKESALGFFDQPYKVYVLLIGIPVLLYFKSLWFGFSPMDEQWLIVKNTAYLEKWQSVPMSFLFPTGNIYYRPLFMILLVFDYHMGGLNPFVYHLSGLVLHITSVLLLYRFLLNFNTAKNTAFFLSLLFGLHPALLHAVVWIPGSNDLMLCAVTLASLLCLQNYMKEKRTAYLVLHLLFFAATLATKENAIVLPLVFIAIYTMQPVVRKKDVLMLIASWFIVGTIWYIMRNEVVNTAMPKGKGLLETGLHFIMGMLIFLGKAIFPVQQSVFPTLKNSSVIPGVITATLLAVAYFKIGVKNKQLALTGLGIFFILLALPVWFGAANTSGEHYEQRIYPSMIGLFLFVSQLNISPTKAMAGAAICTCMLYVGKTLIRMDIYKDEMSFVDVGIKEAPDYYLFHVQKADLLFKLQNYEGAVSCYTKAIALRPNYINFYNNRGHIYAAMKKPKEAIADFSSSIAISANQEAYLNRCISYSNINDLDNAVKDLLVLKKSYPGTVSPDIERNIIKRWSLRALDKMNRQLATEPENAELYVARAKLYAGSGQREKALADIQKACSLQPENQLYSKFLEELSK
jgi:tetratricopeptide (TPR) repeat protein